MKKLLLLLSLGIFLFSCGSDDDNDKEVFYETNITPNEIKDISYKGGEFTFSIETQGKWKIENSSDWVSFSKTEGLGNATVKISVSENMGTNEKNIRVSINNKVLNVSQEGNIPKEVIYLDFLESESDCDLWWYLTEGNTSRPAEKYKIEKSEGFSYGGSENSSEYYSLKGFVSYNGFELYKQVRFIYKSTPEITNTYITNNLKNLYKIKIGNSIENMDLDLINGNNFSAEVIEDVLVYNFKDYDVTLIKNKSFYRLNGYLKFKINK